jgi:hypothetical protein
LRDHRSRLGGHDERELPPLAELRGSGDWTIAAGPGSKAVVLADAHGTFPFPYGRIFCGVTQTAPRASSNHRQDDSDAVGEYAPCCLAGASRRTGERGGGHIGPGCFASETGRMRHHRRGTESMHNCHNGPRVTVSMLQANQSEGTAHSCPGQMSGAPSSLRRASEESLRLQPIRFFGTGLPRLILSFSHVMTEEST